MEMTPQEKQQLKARFFGAHIGCDVDILLKGKTVKFAVNHGAITGNRDSVLISTGELAKYSDEEFDIKLVLRPLESITDEEVFEAFNSAGLYGLEVFRDEDKIGIVGINGVSAVIWIKTSPLPIGAFLEVWNNIPNKSQPEYFEYMLVDYLRSKNFCLPFCGLDPVSEGWAVFE